MFNNIEVQDWMLKMYITLHPNVIKFCKSNVS